MPKPKSFTVRLTPTMFHGLALAMSSLDANMEGKENCEIDRETMRQWDNANRGWNTIKDAYYKVND